MNNNFRCIGDNRRGYFVETIWASNMVWIVPGTYPDDPSTQHMDLNDPINGGWYANSAA